MGIHSPFGYVGYEVRFLETFIHLLDNYCSGCHTSEDFNKGCDGCPVGQLVHESKNYLMGFPISKGTCYSPKRVTLYRKIQKELKGIEPYPFFNAQFVWDERRQPDMLIRLRKLQKDMEFLLRLPAMEFVLQDKLLSAQRRILEKVRK